MKMKRVKGRYKNPKLMLAVLALICTGLILPGKALAVDVPDGTIDPATIQKYVIPLVIPPVMNTKGAPDSYNIAVRQFQQQILPGGIWAALNPAITATFPATTVWSYGPDADPEPDASGLGLPAGVAPAPNSQFNYPAYTVETMSEVPVSVRWINDLVDASGDYLPHLLAVDPTVHWANPPMECKDGVPRTDCAGTQAYAYTGPVPIVTHLHGAHVDPHSDGYPEAWWLPAANNIPEGYATKGTLFDDATGTNNGTLGYADYVYRQDQPATTLWYHDHTLGMTRLNVYAGPAGFWLVRGGKYDKIKDTSTNLPAILPGPAPVAGDTVLELNAPGVMGAADKRSLIREIPIVIQDRSFRTDGSLFYPDDREFFEGLIDSDDTVNQALSIAFAPDSDVLPIWNPEAFFNVMVVNGVSWPSLEVAPARYRFRLLNGCNSRFLNLALQVAGGGELPFFQIGAEQGFLPQVVRIQTNEATPLPGNGMMPLPVPAADPQQALLLALAERADVIVDFSGLADGTVVRMVNTGPDEPFGGFPTEPADPDTTGQVMQFVVNSALTQPTDALTASPYNMRPKEEKPLKANMVAAVRQVSLNEAESEQVCVLLDVAEDEFVTPIVQVPCDSEAPEGTEVVPFGPTEALLGILDIGGNPVALKWTDHSGYGTTVTVSLQSGNTVDVNVTETPSVGDIEDWEIYNFTADAHPIHLHLVRFNVLEREFTDPLTMLPVIRGPEPWEMGFKDTVISYPGEITRIRAKFDIAGLYVWHCHIVEHEDNEMMRPYVVVDSSMMGPPNMGPPN